MIQIRPRSSNVIATGLTMSGSAATTSTVKPGGTVIALTASAGERGAFGRRVLAVRDRLRPARPASGRGRPIRSGDPPPRTRSSPRSPERSPRAASPAHAVIDPDTGSFRSGGRPVRTE